MKKFLWSVLIFTFGLACLVIIIEVFSDDSRFGPISIIVLSSLSLLILFSSISLLLIQKGKKEFVIRSMLLFGSIIFVYIFLDVLAGIILVEKFSNAYLKDEFRHHKLKPSTIFYVPKPETKIFMKTNNLGFRGKDMNPIKKKNVYRILMLGDSFTMGYSVENENTFSVLVEKKLNEILTKSKKDEKKVEVINGGVNSYSPLLSFIQLKEIIHVVNPDLVVLNFDMSDLIQEQLYRSIAKYDSIKNEFKFSINKKSKKIAVQWIEENLYLTRLLLYFIENKENFSAELTVKNVVRLANPQLLEHTLKSDNKDRTKQWNNIFKSISRIKKLCDDNYTEFILTTYPWGHQVSLDEWNPGRDRFIPQNSDISDKSIEILESFTDENKIKFLNTFPAFRNYEGEEQIYFDYDMHWKPAGHRIMAIELGKIISENYLQIDR